VIKRIKIGKDQKHTKILNWRQSSIKI